MIRKIFLNFQNTVLFALINFIVVAYTLKYIGIEGRGEISLFLLNVSIIQQFTAVIGTSSLGFVSHRLQKSSLILASSIWALLVSVPVAVFILFFKALPFEFFFVTCLTAVLYSFIQNSMEFFLVDSKLFRYNFLKLLPSSIHLSLVFFLIQIENTLSINEYISCLLIGLVITTVLSGYFLRTSYVLGKLRKIWASTKILFKIGIINQLNNIVLLFNVRITFYFITSLLGLKMLGIFSIAVLISESVWMFSRSVALIFFAEVVKLKSHETLLAVKRKVCIISLVGTVLILGVVLLLPKKIYQLVFGQEIVELKLLLWLFAPGILAKALTSIYFENFAIRKLRHINTQSAVLSFITMATLGFFLTKHYQLEGAAVATSLSQCLSLCYVIYAERRLLANE